VIALEYPIFYYYVLWETIRPTTTLLCSTRTKIMSMPQQHQAGAPAAEAAADAKVVRLKDNVPADANVPASERRMLGDVASPVSKPRF
jgi:hypothetical protein